MAVWNRLHSLIFGGAIGAAARTAIEPQIEPARQHAWSRNRNRILGVNELARMVAQGLTDTAAVTDTAGRNGYQVDKLEALTQLQLVAPPVAEVLELWRRDKIKEPLVNRALAKAQIEPQYWPAIKELFVGRLDPAATANAVQQGFLANAGLLPPLVDGPPFDIPVEQVDLPTLAEFTAQGIDEKRAKVLAELSGNPPAPEQLAQMVLRGQIPESGWYTGIREGRTKTKWSKALLYLLTHPRLTPALVINLLLRGWIDKPEADRRLAAYGYTPQQVQDWFDASGRPAAPAQMATAAVRGINGPDGRPMDEAQFLKGIRESDIRPEWGPMLWEARFLYPSLFQLNRLVTSGAIDVATGQAWARKARYAPEVVAALVKAWGGAAGPAAAPWASKAATRLYTVTHNEFVVEGIDEARARINLDAIGVDQAEQDRVIFLWQEELLTNRLELTPAQIKKAYRAGRFTSDEALGYLENLGMNAADAGTFLAS